MQVFGAWDAYCAAEREERYAEELADTHAHSKAVLRAWAGWKDVVTRTRGMEQRRVNSRFSKVSE